MTLLEILRRMRMDPGMDPEAALLVLLVQRRGGSAPSDQVDAEWCAWQAINGRPTWEGLEAWIATIEANRPVKRRKRKGVRK